MGEGVQKPKNVKIMRTSYKYHPCHGPDEDGGDEEAEDEFVHLEAELGWIFLRVK